MTNLLVLIPAALALGALGLIAFLWALRSGQFEDLDGAAHRILTEDDEGEATRVAGYGRSTDAMGGAAFGHERPAPQGPAQSTGGADGGTDGGG